MCAIKKIRSVFADKNAWFFIAHFLFSVRKELTTLHGYAKSHQNLAEKKLEYELNKPERMEKEAEFAQKHQNDTDDELIEYAASLKMKQGKAFNRYGFVGYRYMLERFGSWQNMITAVNLRIKELREIG